MKKILSAVVAFALIISILPALQTKVYATNNTVKKTLSQEEEMSKYLVKKAKISYKNNNYTVYMVSRQITPKANDYTVIYFDQKGNLVNNKGIYVDLQRLYIMGTCKEPLQTYKSLGGTLIPDLIFGQKAIEVAGKLGVQLIVPNGQMVVKTIGKNLKDGALDFDYASIIWASNEWYGDKGLKRSLDGLYETKTGISTSKIENLYVINDNCKYNNKKVSDLYSKWLDTYFRYASFLSSLDNLDLTVKASSYLDILSKVASIFADALVPTLGDIPEFKKEYEGFIEYFILKDVSVAWDPDKGIKIVPDYDEIVESLNSFFDNLLDFSSSYEDKADDAFNKQKISSDTSYTTRQTASSAAAVIHVVNPKFVLPARK